MLWFWATADLKWSWAGGGSDRRRTGNGHDSVCMDGRCGNHWPLCFADKGTKNLHRGDCRWI